MPGRKPLQNQTCQGGSRKSDRVRLSTWESSSFPQALPDVRTCLFLVWVSLLYVQWAKWNSGTREALPRVTPGNLGEEIRILVMWSSSQKQKYKAWFIKAKPKARMERRSVCRPPTGKNVRWGRWGERTGSIRVVQNEDLGIHWMWFQGVSQGHATLDLCLQASCSEGECCHVENNSP